MKRILSILIVLAFYKTAFAASLLAMYNARAERIATIIEMAYSGKAEAQYALGNLFENGDGEMWPKNPKQAVYWYHKAAEQEYVNAQFKLGECHNLGIGVEVNNSLAMFWYKRAELNGDENAKAKYQELSKLGYNRAKKDIYNYSELYQDEIIQEYMRKIQEEQTKRRYAYIERVKKMYTDLNSDTLINADSEIVNNIWLEAVKAQLETEKEADNAQLNYEATMYDLEKTQIEERLRLVQERLDSYDDLLSKDVTTIKPFFATDGYTPPMLTLVDSSLFFVSATNDKMIHADKNYSLKFKVQNSGTVQANDCEVRVSLSGDTNGINVQNVNLPTIEIGQTLEINIPIKSTLETRDGKINLIFEVYVPDGYTIGPFEHSFETKAFESPLLQVVDYKITSHYDNIHRMEPFTLVFDFQNMRSGNAENVYVNTILPNDVYIMDGNSEIYYSNIKSGEKKQMRIVLAANNKYASSSIPIRIDIKEKYGKFAQGRTIKVELVDSPYPIISYGLKIINVPRISMLTKTSVVISKPEWFGKYHKTENVQSPFPYAAIKFELQGDKEAVELAKQRLSLTMGGKYIVEEKDDTETNAIWFLVHCRNEFIELDCGDGCGQITIWKERLEPNKVYYGTIKVSIQ